MPKISIRNIITAVLMLMIGGGYYIYLSALRYDNEEKFPPDEYQIIGEEVYIGGELVYGADPKTIESISISGQGTYAKDRSKVYFASHIVGGANPASFKVLEGSGYAVDDRSIFFRGVLINNSNPQTLQFITDNNGNPSLYKEYAKDDQQVYFEGAVLEDANPKTFQLGEGYWAKDDQRIFYKQHQTTLDSDSFNVVLGNYARDKNDLYKARTFPSFKIETMNIVDPMSFEFIDYRYARDKTSVYAIAIDKFTRGTSTEFYKINDIDPASFEYIAEYYMKDKNHVYYQDAFDHLLLIEGADPRTFHYIKIQPVDAKNIYTPVTLSFTDGVYCYEKGIPLDCQSRQQVEHNP